MALIRGDVLQNRYRITALLARGGMAAIYRGWHTTLKKPIAIKEMRPQPGIDAQTLVHLRQQFRQEAAILARLEHPNLVNVLDFFEEGDKAYLVMDLVEGESLAEQIEREGALPEDQVLKWADQLLDALAHCHSRGAIHRDVKPANIIIRPDGRPVLVDFGLVKLWDPDDPNTKTVMQGMGTPEYAPPEQYGARPGHTDPRSDLYSLGATLYHALAGETPMTATERMAGIQQFKSPQELNPRVSARINATIMTAIELRVTDRFESAAEMRAALDMTVPAPLPQVRLQSRAAKPSPRWVKALFGIVMGAIAFLILVVGLVMAIAQPPRPTPPASIDRATMLPILPSTNTAPPPPASRLIGRVTSADVGQTLKLRGTLGEPERLTAGVQFVLADGTGSITLVLRRDVLDAFPDRDLLAAGTHVEVVGEIQEHNGELTIIPATEKGIRIIE
ncbi:MAG: protein kinase [Anaerolineae bacterium]|nr:protein kinase [Anaerolineae bacterium]